MGWDGQCAGEREMKMEMKGRQVVVMIERDGRVGTLDIMDQGFGVWSTTSHGWHRGLGLSKR